MLNSTKNGLLIFDRFVNDYELPKHKIKNRISDSDSDLDFESISVGGSTSNFINPTDFDDSPENKPKSNNIGVIKKIFNFFKESEKEKKPNLTIQDFFKSIKKSVVNIEEYTGRINDYIKTLEYAKQLNQHALVSKIEEKINQVKFESILYASDFRTVITEEQVVKFYKESPKGLRLTWIRNYIRIIPEMVVERKIKADSLNVFDNYVILHYDPNKKAFLEEEKDPILFGVINGIRKLYYISDWIDEYCDLTLEQFIDKFGQEVITKNNITVNFKL